MKRTTQNYAAQPRPHLHEHHFSARPKLASFRKFARSTKFVSQLGPLRPFISLSPEVRFAIAVHPHAQMGSFRKSIKHPALPPRQVRFVIVLILASFRKFGRPTKFVSQLRPLRPFISFAFQVRFAIHRQLGSFRKSIEYVMPVAPQVRFVIPRQMASFRKITPRPPLPHLPREVRFARRNGAPSCSSCSIRFFSTGRQNFGKLLCANAQRERLRIRMLSNVIFFK